MWSCWSGSRGGPQRWSEGWSTSLIEKGWGSWALSAWRRESHRDLIMDIQYLKVDYKQEGNELFTWVVSARTRKTGFKLKDGRFRLDIRKNFFFLYWEGGEAVAQAAQRSCECPIPGGAQGQVGWTLGSMSWWGAALPMAGGWNCVIFMVPSHSVIHKVCHRAQEESMSCVRHFRQHRELVEKRHIE